ncbi:MAG: glutamate mutase L, partial [Candidatus Cloacimonetes bacterium]|nr:glutamate mutase L [Candidatus Cloacimonadota bacterium]
MKNNICKSCGISFERNEDQTGLSEDYCSECLNEDGRIKNFNEILEITAGRINKESGIKKSEALEIARLNLQMSEKWANRERILTGKDYIVITDIGSTTTKAILVDNTSGESQIIAKYNSSTTVEKPLEDVMFGACSSIRGLEKMSGVKLMIDDSVENDIILKKNVAYLSTSSAGGGLQIIAIGLTSFDSASTAKRTAYGAGGVLLDVFSVVDKRTNLEIINLISGYQPDIILFSGGYDDGAITPIIRMAELIATARPTRKFYADSKIPLIFAGNHNAAEYIQPILQEKFDLHILPNIRPDAKTENHLPSRKKIGKIFMDNVMEYAPGYKTLKQKVADEILPTP